MLTREGVSVLLTPASRPEPVQEGVSVLTTEIEHINADAVEAAAQASGLVFEPKPATIRLIQVRSRPVLGTPR